MTSSDDSTAVYRLRDARGLLLYVGVTSGLGSRLYAHEATRAWFRDVTAIEVEWHPTRAAALAAELAAIRSEAPIYNVAGRVPPSGGDRGEPRRTIRVPDDLWSAAVAAPRPAVDTIVPLVVHGGWSLPQAIREFLRAYVAEVTR